MRRLITHRVWLAAILLVASIPMPVAATGKQNVIDYWHVGNYDEVQMIEQVAERFRKETGITVRIQPVPWGHFQTKYFTAMASGEPPDAGSTNLSGPLDYGKDGGLVDLQQRFPSAVARLKKQIFAQMWPACYLGTHLYGIPYGATPLVGFYRKDIFSRLGLTVPQNWTALVAVIEALNAHGYPYGFVWTRNDQWALGTYTLPFGAPALTHEGTRINWNADGFAHGYRFAVHLWNSFNIVTEKAVELFSHHDAQRALPLYFSYALDYTTIRVRAPHLRGKFGFFPFPHPDGKAPATVMGGRTLVVFRQGKNPEGAIRWIEYLLSEKQQLYKYRYMASLGERAQLDLSVNKAFWQHDLKLPAGHQALFLRAFSQLRSEPDWPWAREANRLLEQTLYQAQDALARYLRARAAALNTSVRTLKTRLARGEFPAEKAAYASFLQQTTQQFLAQMTPRAQRLLDRDFAEHNRNQLIQRNDSTTHDSATGAFAQSDILDWAEWFVGVLLLLFVVQITLRQRLRRRWYAYAYIAPPIISALVFVFIPVIVSLYLSLTRYNPVAPLAWARWVGVDNYAQLLSDTVFWQSFGRSAYYAILVLPIQIALGVALAACLDRRLIPDRLYKFVYFAPLVTSIVSVALIWFALLAGTHYGWVNALLLKGGLVADPIDFLNDASLFLNCVISLSIWQGIPFFVLIFLAGLQNIPQEQYDAAAIDGAGPLRQFFHVTLPNLRPQFVFLVIMGTIGTVQVFEQIYMLGGGTGESGSKFGPDDSGLTLVPLLYRKGFEYLKMGEASAVAYLLFVVLVALTYLHLKAVARNDR